MLGVKLDHPGAALPYWLALAPLALLLLPALVAA